jgi:hypothetical protein
MFAAEGGAKLTFQLLILRSGGDPPLSAIPFSTAAISSSPIAGREKGKN